MLTVTTLHLERVQRRSGQHLANLTRFSGLCPNFRRSTSQLQVNGDRIKQWVNEVLAVQRRMLISVPDRNTFERHLKTFVMNSDNYRSTFEEKVTANPPHCQPNTSCD
jgi:hypothetical protein